ncbi:hypothetical protein [Porticoccus sp.]
MDGEFKINGEPFDWDIPEYLENIVGAWAALSHVYTEMRMIKDSLEWVSKGGEMDGQEYAPDPIAVGLLQRMTEEFGDEPDSFEDILGASINLQALLLHEVTQQLKDLGGLPPGLEMGDGEA